jgi:hypothetical protein
MAEWLIPVVGIVIIGAIIELISKNSPTGRFVRAVYGFFILFVIVEPIPRLLGSINFDGEIAVNTRLLEEINESSSSAKQAQIEALLSDMGYFDCLVLVSGEDIYICGNGELTEKDEKKIKNLLGENIYIL